MPKNIVFATLFCGALVVSSCLAANSVKPAKGKYVAAISDSTTTFYLFVTLSDSVYHAEFFYEDESVWDCSGTYTFLDTFLTFSSSTCTFRRSEEPGKPHSANADTLRIRNIKNESFDLFAKKNLGEGIPFEKWITLKLKKPKTKI